MLTGLDNPLHILLLCVVILLVFGAKRLPEMGRSLGTGMREFKSGITGQHEMTATSHAAATPTDSVRRAVAEPETARDA